MIKKQNRQTFDNDRNLSRGTFKTNSDPRIGNGSFDLDSQEANQKKACSFCIYKPTILNKLKVLKEIIEEKNEKIRELQGIIYNITKVALGQENAHQSAHHSQPSEKSSQKCQRYQGKLSDYQEMSFCQNKYQKSIENKENNPFFKVKKANKDVSLGSSQVKSQNQVEQLMNMKVQIKKQIQNMNLEPKQIENEKMGVRKEFGLKKKLIQIMNVLPKNISKQTLMQFQTLSEPRNQGITALVNTKVSNHKRIKNVGFLKKSQYQDQVSQNDSSPLSQSLSSQNKK